jgi:hypothetical protein
MTEKKSTPISEADPLRRLPLRGWPGPKAMGAAGNRGRKDRVMFVDFQTLILVPSFK